MAMLREQAVRERDLWRWALENIALEVGKDAPLYKAMGTLAWGRFEGEPKPDEKVADVFQGLGYLHGVRDALLHAAEVSKWKGEHALRTIHQRIAERARSAPSNQGRA